jgi:hypothetical protein
MIKNYIALKLKNCHTRDNENIQKISTASVVTDSHGTGVFAMN